MEAKNIKLLDKLVQTYPDAYIKLNDKLQPILTDLFDFEAIRSASKYQNKMKFETFEGLPILLTIDSDSKTFNSIYEQLLTLQIPKFKDVQESIDYLLLIDQLTVGNAKEIKEMIKNIKFDNKIYLYLLESGLYLENYKCGISDKDLITILLKKYKLLVDYKKCKECKFGAKCKSFYDIEYECQWKHEPTILTEDVKININKDLERYGITLLGKSLFGREKKFDNSKSTYIDYSDGKITTCNFYPYQYKHKFIKDNEIYYIINISSGYICYGDAYMLIVKSQHKDLMSIHSSHEYDRSSEIEISGIKYKHLMLFQPYKCKEKLDCSMVYDHIHEYKGGN